MFYEYLKKSENDSKIKSLLSKQKTINAVYERELQLLFGNLEEYLSNKIKNKEITTADARFFNTVFDYLSTVDPNENFDDELFKHSYKISVELF